MTPDALDAVLSDYYRSGTPAQAVEALRHLLQAPDGLPPERLAPIAAFFASVGRRSPEAAAGYRALHAAGPAGRLLDAVLHTMDGSAPRAPVRSAVDLDVRWSVFFATGDAQPVRDILAVLAWDDRLRARIEAWLGERKALDFVLGPARRRAQIAEKLRPLGVALDDDHLAVRSAVDLDCDTILRGVNVAPDKVKLLQQTLPTPLGEPELLYMATKTAALWSLASNAARHPAVFDACLDAQRRAAGPARLSLLAVVCEARLARGEAREAVADADAALALAPGHADFLARRELARRRVARDDAFGLFEADEAARPVDPADTASLRARCAAQLPAAYGVHAEIRAAGRPGNPDRGGLTSEWDAVFQRDRSRGERWFWDAETAKGLADRWVTLPGAHYEFPGLWVRLADALRAGEMQALQVETCAALLAQPPDAAERVSRAGVAYRVLRYDNARLPRLLPLLGGADAPCTAHLWLREEDAALRAVRVRRGGDGAAGDALAQVFLDATGEPRIEAPADAIDARKGTRVVGEG